MWDVGVEGIGESGYQEWGIRLSGEQDVGAEDRWGMARGAGRMPSGRAGGTPATRCRRARRGKISYGVWRIAYCVVRMSGDFWCPPATGAGAKYGRLVCRRWRVRVIDCRYRPLDGTDDKYRPGYKGQDEGEYYIREGWEIATSARKGLLAMTAGAG